MTAKQFIETVNCKAQWKRYLESPDDKVSLDCWKYLNDRVDGKPTQAVDLTARLDTTIVEALSHARKRLSR
jgi:hypothetical protein